MPRILYKYLDIVGAKCMIGNQNLQFTNASQLNDPFDCHQKLIDYSKKKTMLSICVMIHGYVVYQKSMIHYSCGAIIVITIKVFV